MENPLFAPVPIQYSLFPALAGHLVHAHTGADLVTTFLWQLPAIGVVFLGIGVAGLLAEWGVGRGARIVTVALTALGGDLSFLTRTADLTGLERARHLLRLPLVRRGGAALQPVGVRAVPVTLAALVVSGRWLVAGRPRDLALAGLVIGALWQTKVFAFLSLMAGTALAALFVRRPLLALAAAGMAGAAPWVLLTAVSAGGRSGWPLQPDLLRPVRRSLELNETLRWAAGLLGDGAHGRAGRSNAAVRRRRLRRAPPGPHGARAERALGRDGPARVRGLHHPGRPYGLAQSCAAIPSPSTACSS